MRKFISLQHIINTHLFLPLLVFCLFPLVACLDKGFRTPEELLNITYDEVSTKFTAPEYTVEFYLTDNLPEYQRGLLSKIPAESFTTTKIREAKWTRDGNTTVVWFTQSGADWISIDALEWDPKKIQF